jgi:hypothetical protein
MTEDIRGFSLAERIVGLPLLRLHNSLYQRTNGRIGHRMPGMPPFLMLHTTGAKTGALRSTAFTYARDGQDFLVVASKGGAPTSPGWYHNLKKHAAGRDQRRDKANRGHRASRAEAYQQRTTRPIPVVRLTPT